MYKFQAEVDDADVYELTFIHNLHPIAIVIMSKPDAVRMARELAVRYSRAIMVYTSNMTDTTWVVGYNAFGMEITEEQASELSVFAG
jgi:hypothetical protein